MKGTLLALNATKAPFTAGANWPLRYLTVSIAGLAVASVAMVVRILAPWATTSVAGAIVHATATVVGTQAIVGSLVLAAFATVTTLAKKDRG